MGDPNSPPTALVFDLPSVKSELRLAASQMAMNVATSSGWKPADSNWVDNWAWAGRKILSLGQWKYEGQGSQVVDTDYNKYVRLREENYRLFSINFVRYAVTGPSFALTYLQDKINQRKYAQEALAYKFESARRINQEVTDTIDWGINFFFAVKTIANTAGVVAGSLASLPVSLTFGIGYAIAATLAESVGQGQTADLVAFVQPPAVSGVTSAGQQYLSTPADIVNDAFVTEANRAAQTAEARLLQLQQSRTVQAMGSGGQRMIAQAEANLAQAEARAAQATASRLGARAMKIAGTGAAIFVGLWCMREDLIKTKDWIFTGQSYTDQLSRRPH